MIDNPNTTSPDSKDLHRVLLMIAKDFDQFCKKHSIEYFLMGGTALGAMRHGGFIPWDDDFDVFMDRSNYLKFLNCANQHIDAEKYYLQKENTKEWPLFFSKIRLNGSVYKEEDNEGRDMHQGVYIDVMCLHNAFEMKFIRYLQYLSARILSAQGLSKKGYSTKSIKKKLSLILSRAVSFGPAKKFWIFASTGLVKPTSSLVGHFFGRAPFERTTFQRSYLGTARYVSFENLQLPVPEFVENYLEVRYGPKYMDSPSMEVRALYPSHAVDVDLGEWGNSLINEE